MILKRFLHQAPKRYFNQGSKKYLIKLAQGVINELCLKQSAICYKQSDGRIHPASN